MKRDEFSRAIEAFMGELSILCLSETDGSLSRMPILLEHLVEVASTSREWTDSNQELLSAAFGIVDRYVEEDWERVINEAFRFYTDQNTIAEHHADQDHAT